VVDRYLKINNICGKNNNKGVEYRHDKKKYFDIIVSFEAMISSTSMLFVYGGNRRTNHYFKINPYKY
jgi:hypothetical protein